MIEVAEDALAVRLALARRVIEAVQYLFGAQAPLTLQERRTVDDAIAVLTALYERR